MPANLLIYKSIWQGTINSFPAVGCAEGGYLPPGEGRRDPHQPCPAEPNSLCALQPRPTPSPSLGALTGTSSSIPHSQTPFRLHKQLPQAGAETQPPKHDLEGKITEIPKIWCWPSQAVISTDSREPQAGTGVPGEHPLQISGGFAW